jgi:hypothetical protein
MAGAGTDPHGGPRPIDKAAEGTIDKHQGTEA